MQIKKFESTGTIISILEVKNRHKKAGALKT